MMARRKSRKELSGIFDFFRKLVPPPISLKKGELIPIAPKEKKEMAPYEIFKKELIVLPPSPVVEFFRPPHPVSPEKEEPQKALWEVIAPAPKEEALEPVESIFREEIVERAKRPEEWPFGEPPVWTYTRWEMPSTMELINLIRQKWDLTGLFEYVLSQVETPAWHRQVEESAHLGQPAILEIEPIAYYQDPRGAYGDIANFLNIPDHVIEQYGRYGPEGAERFKVEVLDEMAERIGKALDILRPTWVLRGYFNLEQDADLNWWLTYRESRFG